MEPLLEVRELAVRYGSIEALRGVLLSVRPGEFVAIVGPNGAGKSTLVNTIAGLLRRARGPTPFDGARRGGRRAGYRGAPARSERGRSDGAARRAECPPRLLTGDARICLGAWPRAHGGHIRGTATATGDRARLPRQPGRGDIAGGGAR